MDAENAFNNLNREAALKNIKEICPTFYRYLNNTYQNPAKLVIPGQDNKYNIIYSEEGSTQGDVGAMAMYGLGIKPLTDRLSSAVDRQVCKQVWYADDSSSAGELNMMCKWWEELCKTGPKYGYFPLASKTILIVKPEFEEKARTIFGETGVKISTSGERHMGAVIGSSEFKEEYVSAKVQKWIEDIEELALIGKDEPQAVYSSFTKAIAHRWSYVQRTIPSISHLFSPLESVIREKLIPVIIGRRVSDTERKILALPIRHGGMGITDPSTTADHEFNASTRITSNLSRIIYNQEVDFRNYLKEEVDEEIKKVKKEKEERITKERDNLLNTLDHKSKRIMELNLESGAGAWLQALPIQSLGYSLNKQEFRDSVSLRYGWQVPNTPSFCQCKERNTIDHALSCKLGGYVNMRHNRVRDLEAEFMKEICHDVKTEPELLPLDAENINSGNQAKKARLDVSGIGVWGSHERTFLDIRIMHPNAPSYIDKPLDKVYEQHENAKKGCYNERIIQVEKGTFTPIVMSTFGGCGVEANKFHKRIATLIAEKRNERYSDVITYMRTRLRFSILKSVVTAIRGVRGKSTRERISPMSSLSFNLLDE